MNETLAGTNGHVVEPTVESQSIVPAPPGDGIRAVDQEGREIIVARDEWRTDVIPGMLQQAWDDPDQLYQVILNSLNDGFLQEMSEAVERLHAIDTIPGRGTCMLAIVQMQTGRLAEAETLLTGFAAAHGEDASVLVNLAKVYADQGYPTRSHDTLWRALEIDPNHDNGLGWFVAMAQEQRGDEAARGVLQRIAALPGSWRAQLWLARAELQAGQVGNARNMYEEALARAPRPVPPDFLMQMSGDLGAGGHLAELVEFTGPQFVPEWHGMPVGNNLIKAHVDLGQLSEADRIRMALAAFNRPDWREPLAFWEAEIARRASGTADTNQAEAAPQMQIGMLRVDAPIWLPQGTPARGLFAPKDAAAPRVTFLGGSAETPEQPAATQIQLGDALGRMTRSLPLYLAEQVEMRTAATGRALVPWAVGAGIGFVVSSQRWPDETAVQAVQDGQSGSDYVVTVHLDAEVEPWTAMLTFIRTSDGTRIGEIEREFTPDDLHSELPALADEMVELLSAFGTAAPSPAYVTPAGSGFASYLLRLEQLLAVRCATMEGVPAQFLQGEQEILQGELNLCLAEPENIPARLLLFSTYGALQQIRPESVLPFTPLLDKLKREQPLPAIDRL